MLQLLAVDTVFLCAAGIEALAILSIFRHLGLGGLPFWPEPILAFYDAQIVPAPAAIVHLIPAALPPWYADAYILSFIFFYLFFIGLAQTASAPESGRDNPRDEPHTRTEQAVDLLLPVTACLIGALFAGLTLLPLAAPLLILFFFAKKLTGYPSRFEIARSFYLNLIFVTGVAFAFAFSGG